MLNSVLAQRSQRQSSKADQTIVDNVSIPRDRDEHGYTQSSVMASSKGIVPNGHASTSNGTSAVKCTTPESAGPAQRGMSPKPSKKLKGKRKKRGSEDNDPPIINPSSSDEPDRTAEKRTTVFMGEDDEEALSPYPIKKPDVQARTEGAPVAKVHDQTRTSAPKRGRPKKRKQENPEKVEKGRRRSFWAEIRQHATTDCENAQSSDAVSNQPRVVYSPAPDAGARPLEEAPSIQHRGNRKDDSYAKRKKKRHRHTDGATAIGAPEIMGKERSEKAEHRSAEPQYKSLEFVPPS